MATSSVAAAIWAKTGVSIPDRCEESSEVQTIPSPGMEARVEVRCGALNPERNGVVLRIRRPNRDPVDVTAVSESLSAWRPQEVLWAPDSSAFVVNGSESAYAGHDFIVYSLTGDRVVSEQITAAAQRDMVDTFPPCKATGIDRADCERMTAAPTFNMSAVAWTRGSFALVVFAEVPCSSTYGGIMCQVMGYEIEARTGRILLRLSAPELKRRYQRQMGWPMRIPGRPSYHRTPRDAGARRSAARN